MAKDSLLGGNIAPLVILVAVVAMVIIYAIAVSPEERESLLGPITAERDLVDTAPGLIEPVPANLLKLSHELTSVEANYAPQAEPTTLAGQLTIKHSFLQDKDSSFVIDVDKINLDSATLEFFVSAKEGTGEFVVELNDITVFSGTLLKDTVSIPLPVGQLIDGSNALRISATSDGTFSTTAYSIKDINLVEYRLKPEQAKAKQTFTFSETELNGLISARLVALAKQLGSPATLKLKLNNNSIYEVNTIGDATIDLDLPMSYLKETNTLEWEASQGGYYRILFGEVKTTYSKSAYKVKSYDFFVTDIEKEFSKSGRYACTLSIIAAESLTQEIDVQINSVSLSVDLEDGTATEDVCNYLKAGDNTISIKSDTAITLSSLKLTMAGKAYGV